MKLSYFLILISLGLLINKPSLAENAPTSVDPTLQLVFSSLPEIKDAPTKEMIKEYTELAKMFWIYKKCQNLGGGAEKEFINNLAQSTEIVRNTFMKKFSMSLLEAQKATEIPQMFALNEMSAKKFMGCDSRLSGDMAMAIVNSRDFIKIYK